MTMVQTNWSQILALIAVPIPLRQQQNMLQQDLPAALVLSTTLHGILEQP